MQKVVFDIEAKRHLRENGFASNLPGRLTVVAALFVGWGVFHLVVALLNATSSTAFFVEWFAVLGALLVSSGWLLYRRHRFGVPVGLLALGVFFSSNIYNSMVYESGIDVTYLGAEFVVKAAIAAVLVTVSRNRRTDGSDS